MAKITKNFILLDILKGQIALNFDKYLCKGIEDVVHYSGKEGTYSTLKPHPQKYDYHNLSWQNARILCQQELISDIWV